MMQPAGSCYMVLIHGGVNVTVSSVQLQLPRWQCLVYASPCAVDTCLFCAPAITAVQAFPLSVLGIILRGVCLMRPQEIHWMFGGGAGALVVAEAVSCP